MTGLIFEDEYYRIVAAAIRVWKTLGYGFLEKVYENALVLELRADGFTVGQQSAVQVLYRGEVVGDYVADLLVNGQILVELKSAKAVVPENAAQVLNYLKATGLRLGILLNFGPQKVSHDRFVC